MEKLNETRVDLLTTAINAASLIAGTGQDPRAIAFFRIALQQQLDAIVARDRIVIPSTSQEPN